MKKLLPTLVSVKRIPAPCGNYGSTKLTELANTMLELGGFLNPPILRKLSDDSYEIIEGEFQVAAAYEARKIDPRAAELIPAFVIETETAKRQLQLTKIDTGANNLSRKTIQELKKIARSKGINPKGDKRKKATWIAAISELN